MPIRLPFLLALLALAPLARAEDWPHWLGPRGDNTVKEEGLLTKLPKEGPKKLWQLDKIGIGYSSPIAKDGKIYLLTAESNKELLTCYDADKGTQLWQQSSDGTWGGQYPGPRATPWIDGTRIYTYGGGGDLICRELADGKLVWQINTLKATNAKQQTWGIASNPLIVGDVIYVQGGPNASAAIAVNKADGKVLWTSDAKGGSYASIIQVDVQGTKQLVVFGNKSIFGIAPADGKTIWEQPWQTSWDVNAMTPIHRDGKLFISSNYNHGCILLELSPTGAKKVYENKNLCAHYQPSILEGEVVYGNSQGTLRCLTFATGEVKWSADKGKFPLANGGSLLRYGGDKLLLLSEGGVLTLAKATPDAVEQLGTARLFDGKENWSMPLIHNKKLYIKANLKEGGSTLTCYDFAQM